MVILIVDSSVLIIERLQNLLSETENITAVYGAVSYKDGAKFFNDIQPNVVLLDIDLPENQSFMLLKEIRKAGQKTSVIILSNQTDAGLQEQYRSMGANFFFDKYHDFAKIPVAIKYISSN
jgi:DNA-binding NarL/FixJ family response regulator